MSTGAGAVAAGDLKTFKSLVTEPGVTGGGSDKEGEALELQEMREAGLQARSEGIFCGPNLDRL